MSWKLILILCAATIAAAQDADPNKGGTNSSVSGTVRDAGTGTPLPNYNVSTYVGATWINDTILMGRQTKQVKSVTDEQGHYKLSDLLPGSYRIEAASAEDFGTRRQKRITLTGQDLNNLDFAIVVSGKISGKVVDENKEPVPDLAVTLVSKEYYAGVVGYFFKGRAKTNDRGEYTLPRVEAGHPYLVMVDRDVRTLPAHSETPLDPKLRRRIPMRTFYPNVPSKEGAEAIVLRPGENREHVDIEIKKAANHCVDGNVVGPLGAGAMMFGIEPVQPSSGMSSGGGMFSAPPSGMTGPDGKFRICDLAPNTYRFTAADSAPSGQQMPSNFALAQFVISDRDVTNVKVSLSPGLPIEGEMVWDGTPPDSRDTPKISLSLVPVGRSGWNGERPSARSDVPGTFSFPNLASADYAVRTLVTTPGLYVKDVTYAGTSVLYEPLRLGGAIPGAGMRVIVGRDGATVSVRVSDKDGNPVPAMPVLVMPAEVASEAIVQSSLVIGETDQTGQYTSHTLAPGKYFVAAIADPVNATTDSIDRLWRARRQFQAIDLAPGSSLPVTLMPLRLE